MFLQCINHIGIAKIKGYNVKVDKICVSFLYIIQ